MKKSVLALALAFGVTTAFAQDLTSKKGEPILPEAGDWSIGIDAGSFLGYVKGLIGNNQSANQTPAWNFLNGDQTIIGKYFADEKTAYRGILRIGFNNQSWSRDIAQVTSSAPTGFPTPAPVVTDKKSYSHNFIGIGGGIEMRKGKTRLQGFYGGDFMIWFSGASEKYTYGNALNSTSGNASSGNTSDFGTSSANSSWYSSNVGGGQFGGRITKTSGGSTFGLGVRGFIGAEYFVLPKLAIGGEFGWGLNFWSTSAVKATYEAYGTSSSGSSSTATYDETVAGKSSGFGLDTDKNMFGTASAQLRMNLYF